MQKTFQSFCCSELFLMLGRRQHTLQEEKQPRRGYLHCPQVLLAKGVERASVP